MKILMPGKMQQAADVLKKAVYQRVLDDYVTQKSIDGLFVKAGQEEAEIRTNPAARTTDLLKEVFVK